MKRAICLLWGLLVVTVSSVHAQQLNQRLEEAAKAQGNAYIEARGAILELGTNAIPMLIRATQAPLLTWQERLVARICCERFARGKVIEALRATDWRYHPPYQPQPQARLVFKKLPDGREVSEIQPPGARIRPVGTGPSDEMGTFVVTKCLETGLWYYFIELTWKQTGESTFNQFDRSFDRKWALWCRRALKDQPENSYLTEVIADRLRNAPNLDNDEDFDLYKALLEGREPGAVPALVVRYDDFTKREVTGLELYPGARAESLVNLFKAILSFADSRHVDLLERFIAEHVVLADLRPKLADVRARPSPVPKVEPPFRMGTNPVVVAP